MTSVTWGMGVLHQELMMQCDTMLHDCVHNYMHEHSMLHVLCL